MTSGADHPTRILAAIRHHYKIAPATVGRYLEADEQLVGFGRGGSESLSLVIRRPAGSVVVRKIVSDRFLATTWDQSARGVMTSPPRKALLQVEYLRSLPPEAAEFFPTVLEVRERWVPIPLRDRTRADRDHWHEVVYDQRYVPGVELSSFVARWRPEPVVVGRLYEELMRLLDERLHRHQRQATADGLLESAYLRKIEDRLALAQHAIPNSLSDRLLESGTLAVNGRRLWNIGPLIELLRARPEWRQALEPPGYCLTMGDANTENVKIATPGALLEAMRLGDLSFSYEDIGLRLLDPRAIGAGSEGAGTIDDYLYDAKFWHNSLGNYDVVHGKHFRLRMRHEDGTPAVDIEHHAGNPFRASYRGLENFFDDVMRRATGGGSGPCREDPNWFVRFVFLMGTHFCAMVPFHVEREIGGSVLDTWQRQQRAIALYCEGVAWLNATVRLLLGDLEPELKAVANQLPTWSC